MIPFWKLLSPSLAHALGGFGTEASSIFFGADQPAAWNPLQWRGLNFPNRVGLAGGADKDGEHVMAWQRLGAGFIEVGTVTPRPQGPNPGKILDRDWDRKNLWNKMGFPSGGAYEVWNNLLAVRDEIQIPLLINLGKNRETATEQALEDYVEVLRKFNAMADAFVVNVSSPNTVGLRGLQSAGYLRPLCETLIREAQGKALFVKLSPDQSPHEFRESLNGAAEAGVSGFVLTNTTLLRPPDCPFPPEGGLSGNDLKPLSEAKLKEAVQVLGSARRDFLLISVGGISTLADVQHRLELGADLVEIYSSLVFQGPLFFQKLQKKWNQERTVLNGDTPSFPR